MKPPQGTTQNAFENAAKAFTEFGAAVEKAARRDANRVRRLIRRLRLWWALR